MTDLPTSPFTRHPARLPVRGWLFAGAMALAGTAAIAGPADYQCDGGTTLKGDFSPRGAQVRYEGENWTLQRVRDSREARYVSPKAGVTITLVKRDAVLERKGQDKLSCKLVVQALRPEALGMAPPESASKPSR